MVTHRRRSHARPRKQVHVPPPQPLPTSDKTKRFTHDPLETVLGVGVVVGVEGVVVAVAVVPPFKIKEQCP